MTSRNAKNREGSKFKIIENITLVKAHKEDDNNQSVKKSKGKLKERSKCKEDENDVAETQSFINYCNRHIFRYHSSSDSSPGVDKNSKDNELVGLPDGHKNKANNKLMSSEDRDEKEDFIDQMKQKEKLIVNESAKKMERKRFLDVLLDNVDDNKITSSPEHDKNRNFQVRKKRKLIKSSGSYKHCTFSSSSLDEEAENDRTRKSRKLKKKVSNFTRDSSDFLSVNNDKENKMLRSKERSFSYSLLVNNDNNRELTGKQLKKKLGEDDEEASYKKTNRTKKQTRDNIFSDESSTESAPNKKQENENNIQSKRQLSDRVPVFSSSSDAEDFDSICEDFNLMDQNTREQKVTEFLSKWCPCDEDVDLMSHLEIAKSKCFNVGETLEHVILNSSRLRDPNIRELTVDLSLLRNDYVGSPCKVASAGSRTKKDNRQKPKASESVSRDKALIHENNIQNKQQISRKFSDHISVFSSRLDANEFNNICDNFYLMDQSTREQRVTEFLRKWCPSIKDVDLMSHIKLAKSKCFNVGETLEDIVLNSSRLRDPNIRELEVDLSQLRKSYGRSPLKVIRADSKVEKNSGDFGRTGRTCGKREEKLQGRKKRKKKSDDICEPQKSQEENKEIETLAADSKIDKPKKRKLFCLESWLSSPEYLALGET